MSTTALADLTDGLVAYWSFDDCTAQSSDYRFDAIVQGDPQCTDGVTLNGTPGKALKFNGSTDWLEGIFDADFFAGDWSIAAWFYHTGYGAPWEAIFSNATSGVNNAPVLTFHGDIERKPFFKNSNYLGMNGVEVSLDGAFVDLGKHFNQWIFAVLTYQNDMLTIYAYKDGQLMTASSKPSWNILHSNGFYIGRHYHGSENLLFKGKIDEVKVYNRALTKDEIQSLYDQKK
jgi:Concanavalin A-like lectin/glucanases superfamily